MRGAKRKFWLPVVSLLAVCLFTSGCVEIQSGDPKVSAPWTIKVENAKPGTTQWRLTNVAKNHEIQGFASRISVNRGDDIDFFVSSTEPSYTIEVYRMGWYAGAGARSMMPPITRTGIQQPLPTPDPETGLIECRWTDPYVLHIPNMPDPTEWASGVYMAKLTAETSGKQNYIIFVVRDDARLSDLLFQSSVTTFQAYNDWGGRSFYTQPPAYEISFNRPYNAQGGAGEFLFWEYTMVRFLEREGYDVTYSTDVDTHERGDLLLFHKAFLSVGHDEYWSWQMRDYVEAARDQGVNLGFFGANASYRQIRFLPSVDTGDRDRTLVYWKSAKLDPIAKIPELRHLATTLFRNPPVNRPEDAMIGIMYEGGWGIFGDMVVSDASSWVFAGTALHNGDNLPGLLGYEVDSIHDHAPPGIQRIAHSPYIEKHGDMRIHYADMTYYMAPSGSIVVATGSMYWNLGLASEGRWANPAVQQATQNIFSSFGAIPFDGQVPSP